MDTQLHLPHLPNHNTTPSPFPPPPATPTQSPARVLKLKILQLNANGLKNKIHQLIDLINKLDIKIAAIQESKLTKENAWHPQLQPYQRRQNQTEDNGGGVAFLVHESIQFEQLPTIQDPYIENIAIKVGDIKIINLYIHPLQKKNSTN